MWRRWHVCVPVRMVPQECVPPEVPKIHVDRVAAQRNRELAVNAVK